MHLEQHPISGRDYTRTVWFAAGPAADEHGLGVFLDGEHYLDSLDARATLQGLLDERRLPPMSFAFVPSDGGIARHRDLVCNDDFARYIAVDLLRWARERAPIRPTGNLIGGVSLSGLAAAHLTLTHPQVFTACLAQSGSFWWEQQRFATLAAAAPAVADRYWLSVGDRETAEQVAHPPTGIWQADSQLVGVQAAVDALRARGADVHHHVFAGGHQFAPWTAELAAALAWLMRP